MLQQSSISSIADTADLQVSTAASCLCDFASLRSQDLVSLLSRVFLSCYLVCLHDELCLFCSVEHRAARLSYQKSSAACLAGAGRGTNLFFLPSSPERWPSGEERGSRNKKNELWNSVSGLLLICRYSSPHSF